ncbi:MAG: hypothetical protein L6282_11070 [Candidatus Methanoperedenaceae archaeon]|nr:hypothetical protein [Candidatus Methanoperedenaceae archaeon]
MDKFRSCPRLTKQKTELCNVWIKTAEQQLFHELEGNLNDLEEQLEKGSFKPLPVLRVYIDKEDGKKAFNWNSSAWKVCAESY